MFDNEVFKKVRNIRKFWVDERVMFRFTAHILLLIIYIRARKGMKTSVKKYFRKTRKNLFVIPIVCCNFAARMGILCPDVKVEI